MGWAYYARILRQSNRMKPIFTPSLEEQAVSLTLCEQISAQLAAAGGWISFADYMNSTLYSPGLGYYAGAGWKFGVKGDFTTAPELTSLFGHVLAKQVAQVLASSQPVILEAGAGSGQLAADLLNAIVDIDRYFILELSNTLRLRQRETIEREAPSMLHRVEWCDRLPDSFAGCVIANELLDAMPVHAVALRPGGWMERGVVLHSENHFVWSERPAPAFLLNAASEISVAEPFDTEIGLMARAWVSEWGHRLTQGALLLIDYGLPRHELYHPQRDHGTLRCYYRHRLHDNPFWWPGLSDITAHVDFTALAEAGFDAGLDVLGYTNQATFLMNCGMGEPLAKHRAENPKTLGAAQLLLAPSEMGEIFKVLAMGRGITEPLLGFARGDRVHTL